MEKQDAELLVALGGAPKGSSSKGDTMHEDDLLLTAAEDIIEAQKERSAPALKDALKRFVSKCMADSGDDEEEGSPESEG